MKVNWKSVPNIRSAGQLSGWLLGLSSSNNEQRRKTELVLKKFCRHPQCIVAFSHQIVNVKDPDKRQMAAVLMRAKISTLWPNLSQKDQTMVKTQLMKHIPGEKFRRVRSGIVYCFGEISVYDVPLNKWESLPSYMMQMASSQNVLDRESGIHMFGVLIEKVPLEMLKNCKHLISVFLKGLRDNDTNVKRSSLRAIEHLIFQVGQKKNLDMITQLIQPLISVVGSAVKNPKSALSLPCFSIFDQLAQFQTSESKGLHIFIPKVVEFMVDIASHKGVEKNFRERAASFCGWVLEFNPDVISTNPKLMGAVLKLCFQLICVSEDDDTDDEEMTLHKVGTTLLDQFCCRVPSYLFFDKIVQNGLNMLKNNANNVVMIKAGISILGVIAEGCYEKTKKSLNTFLPIISNNFKNSSSSQVRKACVMCIVNYAEYCIPEVAKYHGYVLPLLIQGLRDNSVTVKIKVVLAIDRYVLQVGKAKIIKPYAKPIMEGLFNLLKIQNYQLRLHVVSSISSLAERLRKDFMPYFKATMDTMKMILANTNKSDIVLRGRAIEAVGIMSRAVGMKIFNNYVNDIMNNVLNEMKELENAELNEYCFNFLNNVCCTYGVHMNKNYLKRIMEIILNSLENPDGDLVNMNSQTAFLNDDSQTNLVEGSKLNIVNEHDYDFKVRTSGVDEKAAALGCLGQIAVSCKHLFHPYFKKFADTLKQFVDYFHPTLKKLTYSALQKMFCAMIDQKPSANPKDWNIQQLPNVFVKRITSLFDPLMKIYSVKLVEEEDKESVGYICESISDICEEIGFLGIRSNYNSICNGLVDLIKKGTECYDVSERKDDPNADHDLILFDYVLDCIGHIAKLKEVSFEMFQQYWDEIFKVLFTLYTKHKNIGDRVAIIGTFSEMLEAFGKKMTKYVQKWVPFVLTQVSQEDMGLKRNSIYCLGLCTFHCLPLMNQILDQKIIPVLIHPIQSINNANKYDDAVVDNACGAVSRLLLSGACNNSNSNARNFNQLLNLIMNVGLPLRDDYEEYEIVLRCVIQQLVKGNNVVLKNMNNLIIGMGNVMSEKEHLDKNLTRNGRNNVINALLLIAKKWPNQLKSVLSNLKDQNSKQAILSILNSKK